MDNCPICKNGVTDLDTHFQLNHPSEYQKLRDHHEENGEGDFILSAAIGAATGSALLGGMIGGDFLGGALGSFLD